MPLLWAEAEVAATMQASARGQSARAIRRIMGLLSPFRPPPARETGLGSVLETPAYVAGFDDVAMVGEPVEQGGGHFNVAEVGRPFAEG